MDPQDRDAHNTANRKYYENHRVDVCARARERYLRQRERAIARALAYYYAHREEIRAKRHALRHPCDDDFRS